MLHLQLPPSILKMLNVTTPTLFECQKRPKVVLLSREQENGEMLFLCPLLVPQLVDGVL